MLTNHNIVLDVFENRIDNYSDFQLVGQLDDFISFRMTRRFFSAGQFEIHCIDNENTAKICKIGNLIQKHRVDEKESYIIESVQRSIENQKRTITIYGRAFVSIYQRLSFSGDENHQLSFGSLPYCITEVANQAKITFFLVPRNDEFNNNLNEFTGAYSPPFGVNCYDYLMEMAKLGKGSINLYYDYERKLESAKGLTALLKNTGINRSQASGSNTPYTFSFETGNMVSANLTETNTETVNHVVVYEKIPEIPETKYSYIKEVWRNGTESPYPNQFDRFLNASDYQREEGETESQYNDRIHMAAIASLVDPVSELSVEIDPIDYKKEWDLGDIVDISISAWNMLITQRIVEVEEIAESGSYSINVIFGTPFPEAKKGEIF